MAAEAKIRNAPAPKPSNVNVADRVAESIIRGLCRILLKRLVDLRKMTADGFLVQDRINEAIEELLRWRAQVVDERLAPCGDGDQLRALHDALGRTFRAQIPLFEFCFRWKQRRKPCRKT